MSTQTVLEAELIARLAWLVKLRWVAVAGIVLSVLVLQPMLASIGAAGQLSSAGLIVVAAAVLAYNLWLRADVATIKREGIAASPRALARLALLQIGLDLLALTWLIHLTGGLESPLAFFLVFHIIIAGILLGPTIALLAAGGASALYLLVTGLEYAGILPHYHLPLLSSEVWGDPILLIAENAVVAMTLFSVAYLTSSITARLVERERELQASMESSQAKSRELEVLNAQLQRVDQERTRFMMLVTHELRAPLSIIYSAMDVVLGGLASPEQTRQVLSRAQNRATELLALVDDLLELTRAREEGTRHERHVPTHPGGPLRDVVDFVRVEAQNKGVALDVDVAPELPPAVASSDQMKLVWSNLLSNAVKYTPAGGKIRVSLGYTPDQIVGSVEDNGIGIPAKDIPHIFDEFFRSDNARQVSVPGTGIGLAVVQRIVENCGGTIRVESEIDSGTRIEVRLPRADVQARGKPAVQEAR
jgi:signal transduction histidine kinase